MCLFELVVTPGPFSHVPGARVESGAAAGLMHIWQTRCKNRSPEGTTPFQTHIMLVITMSWSYHSILQSS